MKSKFLMLTILAVTLLVIACKKEQVEPTQTTQKEQTPIAETRLFGDDGPVGTDPNSNDDYIEFSIGLGGHIFDGTVDGNFNYTSLTFAFTWFPQIAWGGSGPMPPFTFNIYQVDCNTGQIIGPALTTPLPSLPTNSSNFYTVQFTFVPPILNGNCYIIEIITPYGSVIQRQIF